MLMELTLSSLALNNRLLSTLLTAVWILVYNGERESIYSNKSMHKISFIFVKTLQALFRDFHASAFFICREQVQHPSCAKLFHIQFFCKIYPTRSFKMPIVSANSCTFICWSSNTISCTCSTISGGVARFGCPSRGSSSRLVRPRLNSATH